MIDFLEPNYSLLTLFCKEKKVRAASIHTLRQCLPIRNNTALIKKEGEYVEKTPSRKDKELE